MGFFDGMMPPEDKRSACYLLVKAEQLGLTKQDIDTLMGLVNDTTTWSAGALARALNARGFVISRGVIDRHRSAQCPCERNV